jgi:predicted permease
MKPGSGLPRLTLRLYRALARALPEDFHTKELLDTAEDTVGPVWRRQGVGGLMRLLFDLAVRLPVEHASEIARDLRYGMRALAASPGFTAAAITSMALGICIATCAISEMNGIALRPVPQVAQPRELVATQVPISYPLYRRFRSQTGLFTQTAGWIAPVPFDVVLNNGAQRVWGHLVTTSYFATLGIRPALGAFFDASYETSGPPPAVVVTDRFWREHLAGDPGIVGRTLRVNGHLMTILGVAQAGFLGASPIFFTADLFLPITSDPAAAPELAGNILERPDAPRVRFTARLRRGVTQPQAEAALDAVGRQFERDQGATEQSQRSRRLLLVPGGKIIPMRQEDVPLFTSFLVILAGLVMTIACGSVANMLLARAASRRREIAVRLALGASRVRIVRQLVTESMLITTAAGVLGFAGSAWMMHGLSQLRMPFPMPVRYDFEPDVRVLLVTLVITLATGIAFGVIPARQATRTDLTTALKEGGDVRLRRHRRLSLRNLLIVSQVAGSLTLLVVLGLMSVGIQSTLGIQAGFDPARLYLLSLDPVRDGYSPDRAAAFFKTLLDRVQALPSVQSAALTESVPVAMQYDSAPVFRPATRVLDRAVRHVVGKDYFAATGIPILAGRPFRRDDETSETTAVVISAALAARFFPGADPVGQALEIGSGDPAPARTLPGTFDYRTGTGREGLRKLTIAGVAGDVAEGLVTQKPRPAIYFPLRTADYAQPSPTGVTLILRAAPGVDAVAAVRREIAALDAGITTFQAQSMHDHVEEFMSMLHAASWTYGLVGVFGYVLAGVGLAGVTAYAVQQRRREIGIRMALGALALHVLGVVMKEGAVLVGIGAMFGLAGALAAARLLDAINGTAARITSTNTDDARVLVGSTVLLGVLALCACYLPARRATHIDPAITLRSE